MTTSPAPRENLTLLIAGHRPDRLPQDQTRQALLRRLLHTLLRTLRDSANKQSTDLRIVTGTASGCDTWSLEAALELGVECRIIGANIPPTTAPVHGQAISRAWLGDDSRQIVPEAWFAAADEAKLSMADLLLVVWDGQAPRGFSGGTVRLVIETLRRSQPVVWLDASDARTGHLLLSGPLSMARAALLDADETHITQLTTAFTQVLSGRESEEESSQHLDARLSELVQQLTRPKTAEGFHQLMAKWDTKDKKVYAGLVFSSFLTLFRCPKREGGRVLKACRGPQHFVDGSQLTPENWAHFDAVDRAAAHAALSHRDQTVSLHVLAALAVIFAVAGGINLFGVSALWALAEIVTLVRISWLVVREKRRKVPVHRAWLLLRQAAEAFRMQVLLRPFFASLPALERRHWQSGDSRSDHQNQSMNKDEIQLVSPQTWWASRSLREAGPLTGPAEGDYVMQSYFGDLAGSLRSLIEDQHDYHAQTHARWEKLHHGLERTMLVIFILVTVTVLLHLFALGVHFLEHHGDALPSSLSVFADWLHEQKWLLLITAAGPALAACLHGIGGKLGVKYMAEQSYAMKCRLANYMQALEHLVQQDGNDHFMALRALAIQVASAMYAEHEVWYSLLNGSEIEIPA